jgi:hypothetical protein
LTCTTFGAPRPGNHAFANSFRETVPDAWDIFHPDDAVARAGKFLVLYKRAAHTVVISHAGELVVRPSYAETAVRRGVAPRLAEHLLTKYAFSLGAILKSAIRRDGQVDLINEARPVLENENVAAADGKVHRVTATQVALQSLLTSAYVEKFMTSERAIRKDSLLRMAGAPADEIEKAKQERLEEEAAEAEANHKTRRLNCGNCGGCMHDGVIFNRLPPLSDLKNLFGRDKSDLELHVQD